MQTIDYKPVSLAGSRWEKTVLTGPLPEPEPEHEKDEDGTSGGASPCTSSWSCSATR